MASLLVGAFLAGAAVLTRSEALAVYLPAPLVWLAFGPKRLVGLASGVALLAVMLLVMSPWVVRNYKATTYLTGPDAKPRGRFVLTTLKVGESLYEAVGPLAIGGPNKHLWSLPSDPEFTRGDEYEQNRYLLKISLEYMKSQPMRALRLALVKFRRTWNVVPNYENAQTPFYRIVSLASYVPVLVTGLLGLFVVAARRGRALGWILLPIVVMTTVHMVFVGSVRYRLPMMPFVMVLSGAAVWWLACKLLKVAPETAEN
jgi:hypothetical protein